ncbi:hypothetical protein A4A49_24690 [Nicotiana attenuata]|uniref:Uncharacterized protein n=1 Tax=Nicotiana attenuata TaxID=49451 RepID=A0A1J6ICI8_NICAT|nr:hypothetical protein A4A49_24690 [Nicotiana attenuata]
MSYPNGKGNDSSISKTMGVVAGMAFAAWGLSKMMGSSSAETEEENNNNNNKMMKKPGADGYMYRDDFEKDPKTYFRDLHRKK